MVELIKIPQRTLYKIDEVRRIKEPYLSVCGYIDLVENYFLTERGSPIRYDEKEGSIKDWKWESYERFQQKVKSEGFLFHNEVSAWVEETQEAIGKDGRLIEVVHPDVLKYFKENIWNFCPVQVDINSKPYVIQVDSIGWSYHEGDYGNTKSGIVIQPIKKKLGLDRLIEL
jgi:hypothetical protein